MRVAFPLFLTAIFFVTTDCHFREIDLIDLTKVTIFFCKHLVYAYGNIMDLGSMVVDLCISVGMDLGSVVVDLCRSDFSWLMYRPNA
jgi:hypothetical protein